jgi:hypothetical protein
VVVKEWFVRYVYLCMQAEKRREEQIEHNRGIFAVRQLQPMNLNEEAVKERGIRRAADKVCTCESTSACPSQGAMTVHSAVHYCTLLCAALKPGPWG